MTDRKRAVVVTAQQVHDMLRAAYVKGINDALWVEKIPPWTEEEEDTAFKFYIGSVDRKLNGKG